jgi:exodeoxyribonuclease VII large subunit
MKVEATQYGDRRVYSVSAFNRGVAWYVKRLPAVWVEGEVTDLRRQDAWVSVFFTLKESATGATLQVTMGRRAFDALELALREGENVHVEGCAEVHAMRGTLAFRATTIERFGLGEHLAAIERLKRALAAEGLFAEERKRPLPRFPRAVGILTGADAAARGDLVTAITTRYPPAHIVVCETRLQGRTAPRLISTGLARLASHPDVDVVVVARGGGSFEDLLPFSDEEVVRAVASCPVPVVSAVGHEQDTPLCDLAADVRASTPTAAARLVVPDLDTLLAHLGRTRERLRGGVRRAAARDRERLARASDRLAAAPRRLVERRRAALEVASGTLRALSPRATLTRGYAIVRSGGAIVRTATAVGVGDDLEIELAAGAVDARVEAVR